MSDSEDHMSEDDASEERKPRAKVRLLRLLASQ
jgi:hypothetical protein